MDVRIAEELEIITLSFEKIKQWLKSDNEAYYIRKRINILAFQIFNYIIF